MTTDELIKAMNKLNLETPAGKHQIKIRTNEDLDHREFTISFDKYADPEKLYKVQRLLCDWQASSTRLYRVRIPGLDSSHGPQYLTRDGAGHVFSCSKNFDLKQRFTKDELDQLLNDSRFKGVPWFEALMRSGVEEVTE